MKKTTTVFTLIIILTALGTAGNKTFPEPRFTMSESKITTLEEVTFNASNSVDPDGHITQYSWNLGNNETVKGEVVKKKYFEPGNYTIKLTVVDNCTKITTQSKNLEVILPIDHPKLKQNILKQVLIYGGVATIVAGALIALYIFKNHREELNNLLKKK